MKTNKFFHLTLILLTCLFIDSFLLSAPKKKALNVDLYVMSLCPFGVQAENGLFPAVKSLNRFIDLNLYFIANELSPDQQKAKESRFTALHGQPEVEENIRQLCVQKYYPKKYLDYILERNKDYRSSDYKPILKTLKMNEKKITRCTTGKEGNQLLSENIKAHKERKAFGSPTIDINDTHYQGSRGVKSFTTVLCEQIKKKNIPEPEACKKIDQLPPDATTQSGNCGNAPQANKENSSVIFDIHVVADSRCKACQPTLIKPLKDQHPKAVIHRLGATSTHGKKLIKKYKATTLPLYVLDKKIESDPNFQQLIQNFYIKSGENYLIQPGPNTYTPTTQLKRKKRPEHLDIFIEALSPETAAMEAALLDFLKSTKKDITFSFHYILQEGVKTLENTDDLKSKKIKSASWKKSSQKIASLLTSPRGIEEVKESRRQICLFQTQSIETFFTYLNCRNKNLLSRSYGESCIEMDKKTKSCIEGKESLSLLTQNSRLAKELGITSGPMFLWENRYGPFHWREVDLDKLINN